VHGRDAPAARLLRRILDDATTALRSSPGARGRRSIDDWVAADDSTWPLSFVNVCGALRLDAAEVRAWIAVQSSSTPSARRRLRS
jgi:hypothetical protein